MDADLEVNMEGNASESANGDASVDGALRVDANVPIQFLFLF